MYGIGRQGEVVIAIIMCVIKPSALLAIRITVEHDDGTGCAPIVCTLGLSFAMVLFTPKPIFRSVTHKCRTHTPRQQLQGADSVNWSGIFCAFGCRQVQGLSVFSFEISHFNFVTLLLFSSCQLSWLWRARVCVCLFVYVDVRLLLSLVFRI